MAIFNMEDSSLGEYLNEHGGAHRKFAKMIADKDEKLKNREEAFRTIGSDAANRKADKARDQREKIAHNNLKYIDTHANDYISNVYKKRRENEKDRENADSFFGSSDGYREAKKNFKRDFGGKSKKTINTNDRKPGTYLAAQKKLLGEAARYILSVLDEMDYTEESGKYFE